MKFLRNILNKQKEAVEGNEKLKKFWPIFDSLDTFAFTPNHTTKSGSHIRDGIDLKRTMMTVIIALVPCLLFGMWNVGHQFYLAEGTPDVSMMEKFLYGLIEVLPLIVVSYGVGLGVEFIFCIKNGHEIQEGFLVSGMLIPLIMPVDVPLWMVGVATAFAVLIGKEIFGGTGMNVVNIALTARAFLFFAHPTKMSGDKVWIDGHTGATPLGDLATIQKYQAEMSAAADAGNQGLVDQLGTQIAELSEKTPSVMEAFIGTIPGSVGETSALCCLIGAIILLWTGIASWRIMVSFFVGGLSMGLLLNVVGGDTSQFMGLDPITQLMLGGFMFGLVFMATDPVTASQTNSGKWIYGFICGFLAILIRIANPAYPEGVMLAILFGNVMAPMIDHMVISFNIKRRKKRLQIA